MSSTPLVSESEWAYSGTPRSMDGSRPDAADLGMGRYRATGYGNVPITNDTAQLESMKRALASGRVLVVSSGLCWSEGWDTGTGTLPAPMGNCAADGGEYDGYHAYTIVGYDDTTMEFIALNSWGEGWGDQGYMRLSYGFAQQELQDVGYLDQIDRSHGGCEMMPGAPATTVADRCAAVTGCAECASTSGCVFCDGGCVAADASRTGPATGSCTAMANRVDMCPAPMGSCAANADCGSCAAASGCAWCEGRSACVAWPSEFSECADGGGRVAVEADQCNDVTGACEAAGDCGGCAAMAGCGWCPSADGSLHTAGTVNCFGGNAAGPDRVGCDMGWVGPGSGSMCPMPDAGMDLDAGTPAMGDAGGPVDGCTTVGGGCAGCNATAGCGFCVSSGACINDSRMGECPMGDWRDAVFECTDCSGGASCADCVNQTDCGWCGGTGTCMTSRTGGAAPPECGSGWYFNPAEFCPG